MRGCHTVHNTHICRSARNVLTSRILIASIGVRDNIMVGNHKERGISLFIIYVYECLG
jgi:hypothetical protein